MLGSTPTLIDNYIDTNFDKIETVYDNLTDIITVANAYNTGGMQLGGAILNVLRSDIVVLGSPTQVDADLTDTMVLVTDLESYDGKLYIMSGDHDIGANISISAATDWDCSKDGQLDLATYTLTLSGDTKGTIRLVNAADNSLILTGECQDFNIITDNTNAIDYTAALGTFLINGVPYTTTGRLVSQAITEDDANHAPSNELVFDALALKANLAGGAAFTGDITVPDQSAADNSTKVANTKYVDTADDLKANLAGGAAFTGDITVPDQSAADNSTKVANTKYVDTADDLKANLASPTLTGIPTAPKAAQDTDTSQIATTSFVLDQASVVTPPTLGTEAVGTSERYMRADAVISDQLPASVVLADGVTGVTQSDGDGSTKIATTLYVDNKIEAAITDGETNKAPNQDVVFDALAAKAAIIDFESNIVDSVTDKGTNQAKLFDEFALKAPLANPSFTGNIAVTGTVDGVDIASRNGDLTTLESDVNGFPDELKNLTTGEIEQIENINTELISNAEWTRLAALDQGVATTDDVAHNDLTLTGDLVVAGTINGANQLNPVKVGTIIAGTLVSSFENGDSVDGITLVTGDRILIKNQVDETENGVYIVNASGAPTRATDADETAELNNATVRILNGTLTGLEFTQITVNPNIGVDDIVWIEASESTTAVEITVSGYTHGFTNPGISIKSSGVANQYEAAQADSLANANVVGIISEIVSTTIFKYVPSGKLTLAAGEWDTICDESIPTGLTPGTLYYLSATNAGQITSVKPSGIFVLTIIALDTVNTLVIIENINTKLYKDLPTLRFNQSDDFTKMLYEIEKIQFNVKDEIVRLSVISYTHGVTAVEDAYKGGVYSPTQNRIYLVPRYHADETNWHYIDCDDGTVHAYVHGITANNNAYAGGVYSPTQNRIYLVPHTQGPQTNWHYIDCDNGTVHAYTHGVTTVSIAYVGGVYSPTQNRIYLVPRYQAAETNWHYIDCDDGTVHAYTHGITAGNNAYIGGVYSPIQNRIYLVPFSQANETNWHYIDCDNGSVYAYAHGVTVVNDAYEGGVYSPTQNRIYLVPHEQSNQPNWHYIDCDDGTVHAYTHGITAVNEAYVGGVYSPIQNRIYLVPNSQADSTNWHYIDCDNGSVVSYTHGITAVEDAYEGGVYSPTQNRIYLVPYAQGPQTNWHYIAIGTDEKISSKIMANAIFNKF